MEYRIREAVEQDVHSLIEMAIMFYDTTHYVNTVEMSVEKAYELFRAMMQDEHVLLVIEADDGALLGMIGLFIVPFLFAPIKRQAHEVIWWVHPSIQRGGMGGKLLDAAERACKDKGADAVQMIALASSPPQAHALYKSRGYEHTETTFVKEL